MQPGAQSANCCKPWIPPFPCFTFCSQHSGPAKDKNEGPKTENRTWVSDLPCRSQKKCLSSKAHRKVKKTPDKVETSRKMLAVNLIFKRLCDPTLCRSKKTHLKAGSHQRPPPVYNYWSMLSFVRERQEKIKGTESKLELQEKSRQIQVLRLNKQSPRSLLHF